MILKLLLLITVMTTTGRVESKSCCYPDKWEASEGILSGTADDEGHTAITNGNISLSFDAINRRIHAVEEIVTGNTIQMYTVLQLYKMGVQYFIQNDTCAASKLQPWYDQGCIPDNATELNHYRLGLKQNLTVKDYLYNTAYEQVLVTVTSDGCVPVSEQRFGVNQGVSVMTGVGLEGITLGIKREDIFDIPDICKGDKVVETKWPVRTLPFTRYTTD